MTRHWHPKHLSVSAVELFAKCPAQYKARYVDGLVSPTNGPMLWGGAFHKALETLHRGGDYERAWIAAWNSASEIADAAGFHFGPGKAHGLDLLTEFTRRGLGVECAAEVRFSLTLPSPRIRVPILGFIDAITPEEIREYKTSATAWTDVRAALAHQTNVYGWAHQRLYHRRVPVRYVIFSTLTPTVTEFVVEPSPDGLRLFELAAEAVWKAIEEGRYEGCNRCGTCRPRATRPTDAAPMLSFEEAS